ncbi:MAG: ABC transporter ATP-binding protein [Verrucomicrobiota bacterium]
MRETIGRFLGLIEPADRWRWWWLLPLSLLNAGLELVLAVLVALVIGFLASEQVVSDRLEAIVPWGFGEVSFGLLGGIAVVVVLLKNAVKFFEVWWRDVCATRTITGLTRRLSERYLNGPVESWFAKESAVRMRTLNERVLSVVWEGVLSVPIAVFELLVVVAVFVFAVLAAPLGAVALGVGLVLALIPIFWVVGRMQRRWGEATREQGDRVWALTRSMLGGIKEIKVFGKEDEFVERVTRGREKLGRLERWRSAFGSWPEMVVEILFIVGFVVIGAWLIRANGSGSEAVGIFVVLGYAGFRALQPIYRVLYRWSALHVEVPAMEEIWSELEGGGEEERAGGGKEVRLGSELVLEGIGYRYPGAEEDCLRGIGGTIRAGEFVAIVGRTGSGKTTLLHILAGLLAPARGEVRADGDSIMDGLASWRSRVGYVAQAPWLFPGTLLENVGFGEAGEGLDRERVAGLLEGVGLGELDLDEVVGEGARELSGGQRQLVAIARALYRGPEVLLFDEATAALDAATEEQLFENVLGEEGLTRVMVTHRLAKTRRCDRVFLLDAGELVAAGSFEELESGNELFQRLLLERARWLL